MLAFVSACVSARKINHKLAKYPVKYERIYVAIHAPNSLFRDSFREICCFFYTFHMKWLNEMFSLENDKFILR